ncbi:unnamed protein product, partial [Amoebophrya sp. A25]
CRRTSKYRRRVSSNGYGHVFTAFAKDGTCRDNAQHTYCIPLIKVLPVKDVKTRFRAAVRGNCRIQGLYRGIRKIVITSYQTSHLRLSEVFSSRL